MFGRKSRLLLILLVMSISNVQAGEIRCATDLSNMKENEEGYKSLEPVSIFSLLAEPSKYDGRRVSVVGAFRLFYDRISIYATKEHLVADEFSSMLWVDLPQCVGIKEMDEMSKWQGEFVRVDGVFDASFKNFSSGTISNVERVKK